MAWFDELPVLVKLAFILAGFLLTAFASSLPLGWQTLGAYAGVLFALVGVVGVSIHLVKKLRGSQRVGPTELIIAGAGGTAVFVCILAAGFIWQASIRPLQGRAPALAAAVPTPTPIKPTYSAADIDARIQAIDRLDSIMAPAHLMGTECQDLLNHLDEWITQGKISTKLVNLSSSSKQLYDQLNNAINDYQYRFPEIVNAIRNDKFTRAGTHNQ